ncbi:hypothetical protein CTI12_AA477100 [Artemisia annua]|uniref:Uncharacterized protein n=1 Tax=Artemisia annua TaxID=35608 RepID=A0A2U1LLL9_ARTAN|nr:hypothetical protein CTI12_AA477100 [Artemisia annua]
MSNPPELTNLFAKLASEIESTVNNTYDDVLIKSLNQSLNLNEELVTPRVRVLDSALSLMCFTSPQVFESVIDCSVNTIVSVLSALTECNVKRYGESEVLRVGVDFSADECVRVMEACADILGKLNEGTGKCELVYGVVRLAAMMSKVRYTMQVAPVIDVKTSDGRSRAMKKLMCCVPKGIEYVTEKLPLRSLSGEHLILAMVGITLRGSVPLHLLLSWYLDPQTLVDDVSQVMQDVVGRPFLCLSDELFEKMEWRSIIICLAFSPVMFIDSRALLHRWFLLTGLASVLELQAELVSMMLDLLSRPMRWGLSAEIGSKLPFSYAYFLFKHQLFRILAGPLSCDRFLELVHKIKKSVSNTKKKLKHVASATSMVDHKSSWSMAMNFPGWFYFAALLLPGNNLSGSYICRVDEDNQPQLASCSAAAAWYIAWILDPGDESVSCLLAEKLEKLSRTSINRHSNSSEHRKTAGDYSIKLKKPKPNDKVDVCQVIRLWLEEFQSVKTINIQNNVMFRRITLGILIGCSGSLSEDGYELFLHYVATGTIPQSTESQHTGSKNRRWNNKKQENHITRIDKCSRKEAVAGACIVFQLTDIAERMSDSISETWEIAVDFICKIKLKVVKYLLKCVKRLLEFEIDNNDLLLKDLHKRMLRWRHQGKDVFHGYKDLDDAINVIASKLSHSCL